jgi:hypothetical protein
MQSSKLKLTVAMIGIGLVSFAAGTLAQGRYPEINRAEGHLQAALGDLRAAANFYGGHKENAEAAINQALGQLQEAKGFAASHGH